MISSGPLSPVHHESLANIHSVAWQSARIGTREPLVCARVACLDCNNCFDIANFKPGFVAPSPELSSSSRVAYAHTGKGQSDASVAVRSDGRTETHRSSHKRPTRVSDSDHSQASEQHSSTSKRVRFGTGPYIGTLADEHGDGHPTVCAWRFCQACAAEDSTSALQVIVPSCCITLNETEISSNNINIGLRFTCICSRSDHPASLASWGLNEQRFSFVRSCVQPRDCRTSAPARTLLPVEVRMEKVGPAPGPLTEQSLDESIQALGETSILCRSASSSLAAVVSMNICFHAILLMGAMLILALCLMSWLSLPLRQQSLLGLCSFMWS